MAPQSREGFLGENPQGDFSPPRIKHASPSRGVGAKRPDVSKFADLSHRRFVVTGASSGIGRAVALELAQAGADVAIHYAHSSDAATQIAEQIRLLGRTAWTFGCDFHATSTLSAFVQDTWARCGTIDGWVHCAGVDLLTRGAAQWPFAKKLQELLLVDVQATMLVCKEVGRLMQDRGRGVILTIGWDQSDRGMEGDSGELFASAKNAIMGFSRSLAVSLAPEVRVNCIAPGWIKTAWGETASDVWQERVLRETPLQRWGTPEDIAKLARFLASDEASYLTGQVINANGGAVR